MYLQRCIQWGDKPENVVQLCHSGSGSQSDHHLDLIVQLRMINGRDEEQSTAQRITHVSQLLLLRSLQNVINASRNIIASQFVPPNSTDSIRIQPGTAIH